MQITNDYELKALLKEAVIEALEEKKDDFRAIVLEAMEDIALSKAIEEGENSPVVSRREVFKILREENED